MQYLIDDDFVEKCAEEYREVKLFSIKSFKTFENYLQFCFNQTQWKLDQGKIHQGFEEHPCVN